MKTPEQIVTWVNKVNTEHNMLTLDEALTLAVETAQIELVESLREVDRRLADLNGYAEADAIRVARLHIAAVLDGTATPLAGRTSPQFPLDDVPDYYRSQFRRLTPSPQPGAFTQCVKVIDNDGTGETHWIGITHEQSQHILAYISEQNRSPK